MAISLRSSATQMRTSAWHISAFPGVEHVIELFEYLAPAGDRADVEPRNIGASHLCFIVADLPTLYDSLLERGVTSFVSPPVEVDTGINRGGRALYLRGPRRDHDRALPASGCGSLLTSAHPSSAAVTIASVSPR